MATPTSYCMMCPGFNCLGQNLNVLPRKKAGRVLVCWGGGLYWARIGPTVAMETPCSVGCGFKVGHESIYILAQLRWVWRRLNAPLKKLAACLYEMAKTMEASKGFRLYRCGHVGMEKNMQTLLHLSGFGRV